MTNRNPVTGTQNIWFDAQQVDDSDLNTEQTYNELKHTSVINNHIGSGVLPNTLDNKVLFDSSLAAGLLDGLAISAQSQPTDTVYGNQLEVELIGSEANLYKKVKVGVIGLDFEGNLQYELFTFASDELQIGKRHFVSVLVLLFNDLLGVSNKSLNLGGKVLIKESRSFALSKETLSVAQNLEPNLWFRDFFTATGVSLQSLLQTALPLYNVDTLNINVNVLDNKILLVDDVTTQIGQKFKAADSNIQKIRLLLSVQNTDPGFETDLAWNGDLVISVYPLQTNINCPTDIAPDLEIEFPPDNIPLAQISYNYNTLLAAGIELSGVPQPVDFVFSNSSVAKSNGVKVGQFYAVTVKRSGSANKCDFLIAAGSDQLEDSRLTTFTGDLWVDLTDQDLWFEVYSDSAKVTDGQAYESGNGIYIPKVNFDTNNSATSEYYLKNLSFAGNDTYSGLVLSKVSEGTPLQDQRTGNLVNSRKITSPDLSLLTSSEVSALSATTEPLFIGNIIDKNVKFFNTLTATLTANMHHWGVINNSIFIKIVDNPADPRYDTSVLDLVTNLLNGNLYGAKITPNTTNPSVYYRILKSELCTGLYGDVNGDGIVDTEDLNLLNNLKTFDLNSSPPINSSVVVTSPTISVTNGYNFYTDACSSASGLTFYLENGLGTIVTNYTDGVLVPDPNDNNLAYFSSAFINFGLFNLQDGYRVVVNNIATPENHGIYRLDGYNSLTDVLTLRKTFIDEEVFLQLLRADVDEDLSVDDTDGYYVNNYINKASFYNTIGKPLNVLKLTLGEFIDRRDDYTSNPSTRSTDIHYLSDIYVADGYFVSHDYLTNPVPVTIDRQFLWEDDLVKFTTNPRFVQHVSTSSDGFVKNECALDVAECVVYPAVPTFDPGKIDYYVPNDLVLGEGGELKRKDGSFYKVDLEIGTIVLEVPNSAMSEEKVINLMQHFVSAYENKPLTQSGFKAMRFADCSLVTNDALLNNQVRFSVSAQSFSPDLDGYSVDGYGGIIVDHRIGVHIDYATGLLYLNFTNLYQDPVLSTLNTKVQIQVFLKRGGFNNEVLFVDSVKAGNLLVST